MSANALAQLETTKRAIKRAQYEAFEFQIVNGGVLVRNESYADSSEHEYSVGVDAGVPVACDCPADEHYESACKHQIAVAIRKPILTAASSHQLAADGGMTNHRTETESTGNCECDQLLDDFPCWECVRTGYRNLPSKND